MNYAELEEFISKKMRMTHIYQPLMLKTLLESDGQKATAERIAKAFLSQDDSQLDYYKRVVRRWPHITLKKHNVVSYHKGVYTLQLDEITDAQRRRLVELCELRLQKFVEKDPWIKKFRGIDHRTAPGSLRFDVLRKSGGKCALCGVDGAARALDIDHIIPRSWGGKTEIGNLQALCFACNRGKKDRDDTDFIKWKKRMQFGKNCMLCSSYHHHYDVVMANYLARAVRDPADGAIIIAPKGHVGRLDDMIPAERMLWVDLVCEIQKKDAIKDAAATLSPAGAPHCFARIDAKS